MLGSTIQLPTTGWSHSKFHSDLDADIYRGRALSYQFVNTIDGGPAYTWSSIALQPEFMDGQMPMPIVVADERAPGQLAIGKTVKQLIPKKFAIVQIAYILRSYKHHSFRIQSLGAGNLRSHYLRLCPIGVSWVELFCWHTSPERRMRSWIRQRWVYYGDIIFIIQPRLSANQWLQRC